MERADLLYSGLMFAAGCCRSGRLCCSLRPSLPLRLRWENPHQRCYNLIYKRSRSHPSRTGRPHFIRLLFIMFRLWCRRDLRPSFPI